MKKNTLIVIAGPTASGKTAYSIKLAQSLNTVILSADSRQFYKEMSIGTAAPTEEELAQVKHYFVHHISIEDKYDVADYERDALQLLEKLFQDHDTVVMTGGSGLFIDAVCNGIDEMPDIQPEIREKVQKLYDEGGLRALQDEAQHLDPEYFAIVDQQTQEDCNAPWKFAIKRARLSPRFGNANPPSAILKSRNTPCFGTGRNSSTASTAAWT